jgi:hypothetical protein
MASYTFSTTTAQETIITRARTESNNVACDSIGIARGSTQAQVDAFIAAAAAATPPKIIPATTVYDDNKAYILAVLVEEFKRIKALQSFADKRTYEAALAAATQAQKDQVAAVFGLPAGTL